MTPLLLPPPVLLLPSSFVYIPIPSLVLVDIIVPLFVADEPLPNTTGLLVPLTAAKATCVSVVNFFPAVTVTFDLFAANKAIVELLAPLSIV